MDIFEDIRNEFDQLAGLPNEEIDTVGAAFLIARTAYPNLDETGYRRSLAVMSKKLRSRLYPGDHPAEAIEKLNRILFEQEGFDGSRHDYYEPDNSYLNRVMDRKRGIPITLSLIYTEVGRLAGLNLHGVGMPGHFITALQHETGRILIDPFNQGNILSEEKCREMVKDRLSGRSVLKEQWLNPAKPREVIARMLRNLKAIYLHTNNNRKAFEMLHWLLILNPDAHRERVERGMLYEAMGNTDRAVLDFERYLELAPNAADADQIQSRIQKLKSIPTSIH